MKTTSNQHKHSVIPTSLDHVQLMDIVHFLPYATLAIDREKRITIWNKAMEDMTGILAVDMIGKGDYAYTVPFYGEARPQLMDLIFEDINAVVALYPEIICEGDSLITEAFRQALYGGKGAWVLAKVSLLHDELGNVIGAIESIRDITEQRQAEKKLRESEERFRELVEMLPETVFEVDIHGALTFANHRALEMFNCTQEDVARGIMTLDLLSADGRQQAQENMQRILHGERVRPHEYMAKKMDGRPFPVLISSTPISREGELIGLRGLIIDITEHKLAEEAIRDSEEKFSKAFQTAPHAITITCTENGHFIEVNDAFTLMTGFTYEEALADSSIGLKLWVNAEDREDVITSLHDNREVVSREYQFKIKSGKIITGLFSARTIKLSCGTCILSSILDITEHKQAEDYRATLRKVLQILNEPDDLQNTMQRIISVLKTRLNFAAVSIRLQDGEDYPYFVQKGFSEHSLLTENSLIEHSRESEVCSDKKGNIRLDCTCGLVISGRVDRTLPFFTHGGSFWTNDTSTLIDFPPSADPHYHPRNQCMHQGYASLALIPIRDKDKIIGLIQLNDRQKGRFSVEAVELLESIAAHIGGALIRKQAEEALRRSESILRSFVDCHSDMVYLKDSKLRHILANSPLCQFFGRSEIEVLGKCDAELIQRDAAERCRQSDDEALRTRSTVLQEEIVGNQIFEIRKFPVRLADDTWGVGGIVHEVTAHRQAEDALRASQQITERIINTIPMSVFWKDTNHVFLGCNAAFAHDAGFTDPKDIIGKTDYDMVWYDQAEQYRNDDRQVIESGRSKLLIEEPHSTINGKIVTVLTNKTPLHDANGEVSGVLGTYMDITDRKLAEEATALLEKQLVQAQKMEAIGTMAGGIAHDFNNLITAILGIIELNLDDTDCGSQLYQDLLEIKKSAQRAAELTRNMLAFSRKQILQKVTTNLNVIIGDFMPTIKLIVGEKIEIIPTLSHGLWNICADPAKVENIVTNLVNNAKQAMPRGGKIEIETQNISLEEPLPLCPDSYAGNFVLISIADTGSGISSENLTKIFEPFFTTKPQGEGTGLGLSMVYGSMRQHEGFVTVQSIEDKGTTFNLYFPAKTEGEIMHPRTGTVIPKPMGNETILLVEDEDSVRKVISRGLERLGFKVIASGNPGSALLKIKKENGIQLLLTDVVMADETGIELADSIALEYPHIKVLFMSGYTFRSDELQGRPFISKPFSIEELAEKIRQILDDTSNS